MTRCTRCLYDESIPGITFDAAGVCQYCHLHDELDAAYPVGDAGLAHLHKLAERITWDGQAHDFDCIVGLSGGCDSSYTLLLAKELGLRPAAVHFDNGWNTDTAEHNMKVVTEGLNVPLFRHTVDRDEFDSINRAFLLSGTRDFEAPTDIGLTTTLYRYAEQLGVKYIFNGHSFRTEGIAPLGWSYMDGRYIADVCKKFGGPTEFDTFPNLWLRDFVRWSLKGIKRIRPLYYVNYNKENVKELLSERFGWRWYGGHHKESQITDFFMWMAYHRWGIDFRLLGWSALVRSGQMTRDDGLERLANEAISLDVSLNLKIMTRLELLPGIFMKTKKRTERDFATYKRTFELTRPFWWLMLKGGKIPQSFYLKYCKPERS